MISLTGLLIQSSPSYTPVCPGDTVIFTCTTSTTGQLFWSLNSQVTGYTTGSSIGFDQTLDIFTLNLTNISGFTLTSTATVHSVTISQTDTDIYCSADGNNYIEATVNVTS